MKMIFLLVFFLYILALIQTSFLVHFDFKGYILNLILIAVVILNLFEKPRSYLGLWSAGFGGFFLDVFSETFFGFWILVLTTASLFIKFILKKYVRFPSFQQRY